MESNPSTREGGIKTERFNGKNFAIWKYSIQLRLQEHDLKTIVNGSRAKPAEVIFKKKKQTQYWYIQKHTVMPCHIFFSPSRSKKALWSRTKPLLTSG